MKIIKTNYIAQSVKRFWNERDGVAMGIAAVAAGIFLSIAAAGSQVASYNINMGNTENFGISAGKFTSAANTCSFAATADALKTCSDALKASALAYLNYIKAPQAIIDSLVITPGLWCSAENKFISTADKIINSASCSSVANNTPLSSLQVSLASNWSPAAMKSTLSGLNKKFTWTFVGTRVDEVASTNVCPGITLDRNIFIKDDGSANLYDDKNGTLTAAGMKEIKVVYGKQATYGSEVIAHPMYIMNNSSGDRPSIPSAESSSSWRPFTAFSSGTDANGKKRTKLTTSSEYGITDSPLPVSQSKIGQTINDPKWGNRTYNDHGGVMAFRGLKDFENKTCIALLHDGNSSDKKLINEGIEIRINKVCTGSRDRKKDSSNNWIKDPSDSSKYKMFAMDDAHQNYDTDCGDGTLNAPEHSIRFYAFNRTSESDGIVKSDYSKYEGRNTGSSNKEAKGLKGTHEMAERKTAYVN